MVSIMTHEMSTEPWPHRCHGELGGLDEGGDAVPEVEHDQQDPECGHSDVPHRAGPL